MKAQGLLLNMLKFENCKKSVRRQGDAILKVVQVTIWRHNFLRHMPHSDNIQGSVSSSRTSHLFLFGLVLVSLKTAD